MEKIISPVFKGLTDDEWTDMQESSVMKRRKVKKGTVVFHAGEVVRELGVVLKGSVNIENIDVWGNRSLLSNVSGGQVFAETYAVCGEPLMVDAVAKEESEILFFDVKAVVVDYSIGGSFGEKELTASWKRKVMKNMLDILARKNLHLSERAFFTSSRTIRDRVVAYLSAEAKKTGKSTFSIPFDRQGMADYLNVERSALSKELSKMKDDGMIEYRKNEFTVKDLRDR